MASGKLVIECLQIPREDFHKSKFEVTVNPLDLNWMRI